MDLATILKEYPALVAAFSALLLAVLGYLFNRLNSIHNKNLEIEKKEYDRRVAIYNKQIQEAREYVDTLFDLLYLQRQLVNKLMNSYEIASSGREVILETSKQVSTLWGKVNKQVMSIKILNDNDLATLQAKIVENAGKDVNYLVTVTGGVLDGSYKNFDKERLKRLAEVFRDGELMIADMKIRLDKLAVSIK